MGEKDTCLGQLRYNLSTYEMKTESLDYHDNSYYVIFLFSTFVFRASRKKKRAMRIYLLVYRQTIYQLYIFLTNCLVFRFYFSIKIYRNVILLQKPQCLQKGNA